ncbi:ABC1 kinase family protein [Virgibacillus siamensis]|uniref:ABC1 kinase family protein n=1 Tax=Virgibacillus siamensis TaxID=480071 RepID=UPI000987281C|nr:AarF/ABC1/UbiB kinase family protein [Virgibacillus siamensis]
MFGQRIRHTKRYQEIVNVFMKNGFSHFLFRVGLADRGLAKGMVPGEIDRNMKSVGKRLRHALQDLGPSFIKLGQIASTRYDALPPEITEELEKLQDHAVVIPFEQVRQTIETELDDTLENIFDQFDSEPHATASIGQVHIARLHSGEEVVVKVQRPGLRSKIDTDLEILQGIGNVLEERTAWAQRYRLSAIIEELSASLRNELDYLMEARGSERVAKQFDGRSFVKIPLMHWDFSTKRVLTMEKLDGIKVSKIEELDAKGYDRKIIARRLADAMLHQLLDNGFFHADPHSGNIYVLPNNTIAFLDFGETGLINEKLKQHFASIIVNLHQGNTKSMIKTFTRMDIIGDKTKLEVLQRDLDDLHARYENIKMKDLSLGRIILEIFSVAYHNYIRIPAELALISKVILTLEGVLRRLDPDFSLMRATEPFAQKLMWKKYRPKEVIRNSIGELAEDIGIISELPQDLKDVMDVVKKGKIGLDINVKQSDRIMRRLDKLSNRLAFSILMLAFSILMASLIIGFAIVGKDTFIWELPIIEFGAVIAFLMFVLLVITIIRSGRM